MRLTEHNISWTPHKSLQNTPDRENKVHQTTSESNYRIHVIQGWSPSHAALICSPVTKVCRTKQYWRSEALISRKTGMGYPCLTIYSNYTYNNEGCSCANQSMHSKTIVVSTLPEEQKQKQTWSNIRCEETERLLSESTSSLLTDCSDLCTYGSSIKQGWGCVRQS